MSEQKWKDWTPEPWAHGELEEGTIISPNGYVIHRTQDLERVQFCVPDLARIVQCVNACAGLPDPAAEIARLRGVEATAEELAGDLDKMYAELLRVRTTGHGAAHELDNIAVECGLGHSPKPGEVAEYVRKLRTVYAAAVEECKEWRERYGHFPPESDDHDAARAEAGMENL